MMEYAQKDNSLFIIPGSQQTNKSTETIIATTQKSQPKSVNNQKSSLNSQSYERILAIGEKIHRFRQEAVIEMRRF